MVLDKLSKCKNAAEKKTLWSTLKKLQVSNILLYFKVLLFSLKHNSSNYPGIEID